MARAGIKVRDRDLGVELSLPNVPGIRIPRRTGFGAEAGPHSGVLTQQIGARAQERESLPRSQGPRFENHLCWDVLRGTRGVDGYFGLISPTAYIRMDT